MITTLQALHNPVRAEQAAEFEQSSTDYALACHRADQGRAAPYWPFPTLTEVQQRGRAAQEAAMRAGRLAKWGAR